MERGGIRLHQQPNQTLKYGPDIGGLRVNNEEGLYLPAYERYNGRCYAPISPQAWAAYLQNRDKVTVLIMSGLYGLIEAGEWIQEYDVHLTDTNRDTGQSVTSAWAELFDETLAAYVKKAYGDRKVNIFNLLGDHYYVDAIQWHKLPTESSVFHLASPDAADVDLLAPAGTMLDCFLQAPNRLDDIERGKEIQLSDFGAPPAGRAGMRIIFEGKVGESRSKPTPA